MTIHHCPKCELRFEWKTELEDHCWHDHPEFRHDYPAQVAEPARPARAPRAPAAGPAERRHHDVSDLVGWVLPVSGKRRTQRKPG
jgi:hypothetical protein